MVGMAGMRSASAMQHRDQSRLELATVRHIGAALRRLVVIRPPNTTGPQ
jgi:hypothetical protein